MFIENCLLLLVVDEVIVDSFREVSVLSLFLLGSSSSKGLDVPFRIVGSGALLSNVQRGPVDTFFSLHNDPTHFPN
jgi:hypothetical protein